MCRNVNARRFSSGSLYAIEDHLSMSTGRMAWVYARDIKCGIHFPVVQRNNLQLPCVTTRDSDFSGGVNLDIRHKLGVSRRPVRKGVMTYRCERSNAIYHAV